MSYYQTCAIPKPRTRKSLKAKRDRAEAKVKKAVREACVLRDGTVCRILYDWIRDASLTWDAAFRDLARECELPSEWAHMHARRRSQTRNQAPEIRHDTKHSLMLCRFHHAEYDAHRLVITALTRKGADGPLRFRRTK